MTESREERAQRVRDGLPAKNGAVRRLKARVEDLERRLAELEKCCDGGPQWGHAWECKKADLGGAG